MKLTYLKTAIQKHFKGLLVAGAALMLAAGAMTVAGAGEGDGYNITSKGALWQKVHDAFPEIYPSEQIGGGRVNAFLGIKSADLDKDGIPEILAYLVPEPEWVTDDYPGNLHAIFKDNGQSGLTKIWTGTANGLELGTGYTKGMRDIKLLTDPKGKKSVTYEWNGTTYKP